MICCLYVVNRVRQKEGGILSWTQAVGIVALFLHHYVTSALQLKEHKSIVCLSKRISHH